jgi:hypothetical protein
MILDGVIEKIYEERERDHRRGKEWISEASDGDLPIYQ